MSRSALTSSQQQHLLALARAAIGYGLEYSAPPQPVDESAELAVPAACFVTLHTAGALRGCIGSLEPVQPLAAAVVDNAYKAAFCDPRFERLGRTELPDTHIEISVLSPVMPLLAADERALCQFLQDERCGLILHSGVRRATFLPAVWEQLPRAEDFIAALKRKAGLTPGFWSDQLRFEYYRTQSFAETAAAG